jgi:hypothetical protein
VPLDSDALRPDRGASMRGCAEDESPVTRALLRN